MDLGIRSKVAMVAAASKGIGLAIAKELAHEGCLVSICGHNPDNLEKAHQQLPEGSHAFVCDVTKPDQLKAWVEDVEKKLGTADILVTNNGGPPHGRVHTLNLDDWKVGFDVIFTSTLELARLTVPKMMERKWGRIVHITSIAGKEPIPLLAISSTLRAGMLSLVRLQATEFAPYGITVNGVLPGHTLTDRQKQAITLMAEEQQIPFEEALKRHASSILVKRLADPQEIAAAVAFLCSARASYITGVNLPVDGGSLKGH
jgi:3-oxoacyl-[acyl-carrier protein] reductase